MPASRVRVESAVPPGERVPGGEITVQTNPFGSGLAPSPAPTPTPASSGIVSIMLRPNVGEEIQNVAGTTAAYVEAYTLNAQFYGKLTNFPGASGDSNNSQWVNLAVPINLASSPQPRARVHLVVVS